jgi:hypothetical protein
LDIALTSGNEHNATGKEIPNPQIMKVHAPARSDATALK